jgi:hypothetical protein
MASLDTIKTWLDDVADLVRGGGGGVVDASCRRWAAIAGARTP